jgi:hypothetical protein
VRELIVCAWWYRDNFPGPGAAMSIRTTKGYDMPNKRAIEYALEMVEIWASNTHDVYLTVRDMVEGGHSDDEIRTALVQMIEDGDGGSDWLMAREGVEQAAFGDSDGVTFDDIDWIEAIDTISGRV